MSKENEIEIRIKCECENSFDPQLDYIKKDGECVAYTSVSYLEYICARCGKIMHREVTYLQKETFTKKTIVTENEND